MFLGASKNNGTKILSQILVPCKLWSSLFYGEHDPTSIGTQLPLAERLLQPRVLCILGKQQSTHTVTGCLLAVAAARRQFSLGPDSRTMVPLCRIYLRPLAPDTCDQRGHSGSLREKKRNQTGVKTVPSLQTHRLQWDQCENALRGCKT